MGTLKWKYDLYRIYQVAGLFCFGESITMSNLVSTILYEYIYRHISPYGPWDTYLRDISNVLMNHLYVKIANIGYTFCSG